MNDHLVYVDDGPSGELHLSLECRRAGGATAHDVSPEACAGELAAWLGARPGRAWGDILVTTSRVHTGDMAPATRRPQVRRLALGALVFPDFGRGSDVPEDRERDGASWRLAVPGLDRLLTALPALELLVVQASDFDVLRPAAPFEVPRLRRLVLRAEAMNPESIACLGRGHFPALTHLELWLGHFAFGWGGGVNDLAPLFGGAALPALRHLKLVSDLDASLLDGLASGRLLSGLSTLDLADGVFGDEAVDRLGKHFPRFAHLDRLTLAGNALSPEAAARARRLGPDIVVGLQRHSGAGPVPFAPPMVSIFDAFGA